MLYLYQEGFFQAASDLPAKTGWLSITQAIDSELSRENGFQMMSVNSSIWQLGETLCVTTPDIEGDVLKCTADVSLISNKGLDELCTEPRALWETIDNMGCLVAREHTPPVHP